MLSFLAILAFPALSFGLIVPRQNATLSCGIATLQCCDTLALASEPAIANTLGLEGIPLPPADTTIGLNCLVITPDQYLPITAQCIGILSCCTDISLGTNATTSEGCLMAGISS